MRILVFGASGHARVMLDILRLLPDLEVVGLVDPKHPISTLVGGVPVLGRDSDVGRIRKNQRVDAALVAIGDNSLRQEVVERVAAEVPDLSFARAIHPSAVLASDVEVGPGALVAAGAVLNPGVRVGEHAIVNTTASVDHDARLSPFCSIGPGALLGGHVRVGEGAAVGIGATVRHGLKIGPWSVVGAGAVCVRDVPPSVLSYGCPAKVVRVRTKAEPYL